MKLFTTKKEQWFDYPAQKGIKFLIRPLSIYDFDQIPTENYLEKMSPRTFANMVSNVLLNWEGIEANGKPAECNTENKLMLIDQNLEVANFVIGKASELKQSALSEEEVKN
jgi:hypothetical protein